MKKKVSAVSVVMEPLGRYSFLLLLLAFLWSHDVSGLQRPPPRYSQQYMPETSFTCRNKIVGSYYADPESDCQVFHVCVSVAGTIQDYKFLCPNDTAFDQESQTCADWYDVDCEAATLYYASDNFDLYRIGSGLESPHYDAIRSDSEPQDHLQRSESNDPVRSSANAYNRLSSSTYNTNNNRDDFRTANDNSDFYNSKNRNDGEYEKARSYKEEASPSEKRKSAIRKISRKQQYNGNNDHSVPSTTIPASSQNSYTGTFYNSNNYNQRATGFASSSTVPPSQETYSNRKQNGQRYSTASSTYRPSTNYHDTYSSYQTPSTTVKTTSYNVYVANGNYNQESSPSYTQSTTVRSTNYNSNGNNNKNNYQPFNSPQFSASSTVLPSTNYQTSDYTTFQQKNYNIQRGTPNVVGHHQQSTTASPIVYDNHNDGQYRSATTSFKSDVSQTTSKYYTNYVGGSYAPTTYSPATKKYSHVDNGSQTQRSNVDNAASYYDKTAQTVKSSTQYYDNTKMSKKPSQYNNYDNSNNAKYYESSTDSYDFVRNAAAIGFSPVSINHLAETPRSTTPTPRRQGTSNAYNPTTFNPNTQRSSSSNTTPRINAHSSASARPFSSSTKLPPSSTVRPKSGKKNDYDYAYYDNTGPLEYDGLELEQVAGSKESSKLSKN